MGEACSRGNTKPSDGPSHPFKSQGRVVGLVALWYEGIGQWDAENAQKKDVRAVMSAPASDSCFIVGYLCG